MRKVVCGVPELYESSVVSDDAMPQFVRYGLAGARVIESLCLKCGGTVAFAPRMTVLRLAEVAHVCEPKARLRNEDVRYPG